MWTMVVLVVVLRCCCCCCSGGVHDDDEGQRDCIRFEVNWYLMNDQLSGSVSPYFIIHMIKRFDKCVFVKTLFMEEKEREMKEKKAQRPTTNFWYHVSIVSGERAVNETCLCGIYFSWSNYPFVVLIGL